jgi:hypothetical protein
MLVLWEDRDLSRDLAILDLDTVNDRSFASTSKAEYEST